MKSSLCVIASLLAVIGTAIAAPPMTRAELRTVPAAELARRAADQIGDMLSKPAANGFRPEDHRRAREAIAQILARDGGKATDITTATGRARLGALWFPTEKRIWIETTTADQLRFLTPRTAVLLPGLCVFDDIPTFFSATAGNAGPNAPMQPADIFVMHTYHFLTPPAVAAADRSAFADRAEAQAACAKLEGKDTDDFTAEDDASALRAMWLAGRLQAALEDGVPTFPVTCRQKTGDDCRRAVLDTLRYWNQAWCAPGDVCKLFAGSTGVLISATDGMVPTIREVNLEPLPLGD